MPDLRAKAQSVAALGKVAQENMVHGIGRCIVPRPLEVCNGDGLKEHCLHYDLGVKFAMTFQG